MATNVQVYVLSLEVPLLALAEQEQDTAKEEKKSVLTNALHDIAILPTSVLEFCYALKSCHRDTSHPFPCACHYHQL